MTENKQAIAKAQAVFKAARSNLLLMTVLTGVTVVSMACNLGFRNLFSAIIPQIAYTYLMQIAGAGSIGAIAIAVLFLGLLVACFLCSAENRKWLTAALAVYILDCAALVWWIVFTGSADNVLDLVFHAWIVIILVRGVIAGKKLDVAPAQDAYAFPGDAFSGDAVPEQTGYAGEDAQADAAQAYEAVTGAYAADTAPLYPHNGKGRCVISEHYNGMQIEVYRKEPRTLIVVDGQVYAEWKGLVETRYSLCARVQGVPLVCSAVSDGLSGLMRLYADGKLLAEKRRYI